MFVGRMIGTVFDSLAPLRVVKTDSKHKKSSKVFSVGADKKAMMWDLGADSFNQIGAHEQPITCCGFAKGPNYECLVTGSLDKTVKLWDMRQSNPVMTFNCPEVKYGQFLVHGG